MIKPKKQRQQWEKEKQMVRQKVQIMMVAMMKEQIRKMEMLPQLLQKVVLLKMLSENSVVKVISQNF